MPVRTFDPPALLGAAMGAGFTEASLIDPATPHGGWSPGIRGKSASHYSTTNRSTTDAMYSRAANSVVSPSFAAASPPVAPRPRG
mgnify:CR=1 FL=1